MLRTWSFDDSTEHLAAIDLFLAEQILDQCVDRAPYLLEFGVWKGGWLLSLLEGRPDTVGVGVDPYPQTDHIRQRVIDRAATDGLADRLTLVSTASEVCDHSCAAAAPQLFDLVHVDGEHTEAAVESDLAVAAEHLAPDGVIVVDDYRFSWFPGIASALYAFVHDREWAIFLATDNKAYVCRAEHHARWLATAAERLTAGDIPFSRGLRFRYDEPPDVRGFGMVLCLGPVPSERVLEGRRVPLRTRFERGRARWTPPLRETVRPLKRRLLGSARRP